MKRNTVQKTKSDIPAAPRRRAKAVKADPAADTAAPAAGADQALRIIKKYPNRRLYDTTTSSYITLTDVRALVMSRSTFSVRDAKTNEDLTRAILLQIILEEEAGGAPMFTEQVLANIIRFYGNAMQGFMGTYLEKNVQLDNRACLALRFSSKGAFIRFSLRSSSPFSFVALANDALVSSAL